MKKFILFSLCLTVLSLTMSGRDFRFGAETGVDFTKPSQCEGKPYPGYHFALVAEYDFKTVEKGFFVRVKPGICEKSWRRKIKTGTYKAEQIAHPLYFQIPVLAGYRIKTGKDFSLRFELGPYICTGVGGNSKHNYYNGTSRPVSDSFRPCFGADGFCRRLDAGLCIGVGITLIRHLEFGVNTSIQLNKFEPATDCAYRTFGISAGFIF